VCLRSTRLPRLPPYHAGAALWGLPGKQVCRCANQAVRALVLLSTPVFLHSLTAGRARAHARTHACMQAAAHAWHRG